MRSWQVAWVLLGIGCAPSSGVVGGDGDPSATGSGDPTGSESGTETETETETTVTSAPGVTDWLAAGDAAPGEMLGGADVAVAPDGSLLVSWIDGRDGPPTLRVARSRDNGETFESSVGIPGPEEPITADWGTPQLYADADQAVVVGPARLDGGLTGNHWTAPLDTLSFGGAVSWGLGLVEMVAGGIAPDGDVWVTWLDYSGDLVRVMLGNSATDRFGVQINAPLGTPSCECCPLDVLFTTDASPVIAWRDNDDNIRNMAVASGPPGAQEVPTAVVATATDWYIAACPVQGPRLAEAADGQLLMTWTDGSAEDWLVYVASSADAATWSAEQVVAPTLPAPQLTPRITAAASGRIFLVLRADDRYHLTASDDHGATWDTPRALAVKGAGKVERADLASAGGVTWLVAEAGEAVWVRRLE